MAGSDIEGKLSEQWRLVKEAPIPYVTGLIVLGGLMFLAFQWGYARVLDGKDATITQKDSEISGLKTQIDMVKSERDDLKAKLSEKPAARVIAAPPRDPDSLYQFGAAVAQAPGGQIDKGSGTVAFRVAIGNGDFNGNAESEYREFRIGECHWGDYGEQGSFGIASKRTYSPFTCRILGLRPSASAGQ